MERLTMENRPPTREEQEKQNGNQNFRRPFPPPRNQRIHEDQQIRPPFLENYVDEKRGKDLMENQNRHFDDIDFGISFAEGDNFFAQEEAPLVQPIGTLSQLQFLERHNMICEEDNQHDESNCFPFCYDSFEFLRQKLSAFKQT